MARTPVLPPETPAPLWHKALLPSGAALGLLAGVGGVALVHNAPMAALGLFFLGGLFLALPDLVRGEGLGQLPPAPRPFERWEPVFLLLFLAAAAALRFYRLGDIPMGATGAEGEIVGRTLALMQEPYQAHVADQDINWGTLLYYSGGGLAQRLGWVPASFRMVAAFWGVVSLAAFYVVARQVSSPLSAAAAAMLYAGLNLHLVYSRQFFPSIHLLVAPVLALGLYIRGWQRGGWAWFLAAGLALGVSLHGYTAGRVVPLVFVVWFAALSLLQRKALAGPRALAWFWAGFFICASPVLYWALRHSEQYWGLITHQNVHRGRYLQGMIETFRPYFLMWHGPGDPSHTDAVPGSPVLGPLAQVLFPLGFFLCLALAWRPVPMLLVGLVIAGLLPAVMGGGFAHPTTRRTIMAYPAAYLMVALAIERLRLGAAGWRPLRLVFAVAVLAAGAWTLDQSRVQFFIRHMGDPKVKGDYGKRIFLWGQEVRTAAERRVVGAQGNMAFVANSMLLPLNVPVNIANTQEDLFVLLPGRSHRLGLDPYGEALLPWIQETFPGAVARVHQEAPPTENILGDPFNPLVYMVGVDISEEAAQNARRLQGPRGPVDVLASGFGADNAGRALDLRGALIVPVTRVEEKMRAELAWPGWSVELAGRALPVGKDSAGVFYGMQPLRLRGTVPAGASGPLPLRLLAGGRELVAEGRLLGLDFKHGFWGRYRQGSASGPLITERFEPWAVYRFYDNPAFAPPIHARWTASFTPPSSGVYAFSLVRNRGRVKVDGKAVFERSNGEPLAQTLRLTAGQAVPIELEAIVEGGPIDRTIALQVALPGQKLAWSDPRWFQPRR